MSNNPQFHGVQFRPVPPVQQSQQFIPVPSQHFQHVVRGVSVVNSGLPPPQPQQTQFSQPLQHLPPRPVQPGHGPPPSQAIPLPNAQGNMHIMSGLSVPQPNAHTPDNYTQGLGGPGSTLSSSYTFAPPSYGQPQISFTATSQYVPVSQMHAPDIPAGGQLRLSSENQSTAAITPLQNFAEQTLVTTANSLATNVHPYPTKEVPTDWIEHTSADGRRYYFNKKSRLSSWEKPLELMTPIERADASTDWKEFKSPDGRKYYYNKVTKQSKWTLPEELKLAREQVEKPSIQGTQTEMVEISQPPASVLPSVVKTPSRAVDPSSAASSPVSMAPAVASGSLQPEVVSGLSTSTVLASTTITNGDGSQTPENNATKLESCGVVVSTTSAIAESMKSSSNNSAQDILSSADGVPEQEMGESRKDVVAEKTFDISVEEKGVNMESLIYANKLEAKNAFKALLESANVGSDWTWDRAMRVIINDKRYGALKTLGERKQAFNEFLGQRKKQESEERRIKHKKAREEFKKMLEECKELTSSARWSKVVTMFEDDERFKAIERDRDRKDLFENHLEELEKKERAKAQEDRKRYIMEYRQFLESCDFIKANTQWRKVQDRLEVDERCSRLEKIDRVDIFQGYIHDLEKEEEEQRKIQKEELRKAERKNRDEFRKLMEEHVSEATLTAKTHWRDYCMKVKDVPAYLSVASNTSGSTPKDLFEDVSEELQKLYHEDKTRIKDAVKLGKITLSSNWTLQDFKSAISEDLSSPPVVDTNLKLVFDELLERVKEKEEKEAKRRKRLADDFFDLLHSIREITASSKWEDCKQLFEGSQEYSSIVEESTSREIFEEYVTQLEEEAKVHDQKRMEDKAKKEKEREEKDRGKKQRQKERGHEREKDDHLKKDGADSESADLTDSRSGNKRSGKDRSKKHRRRHHDGDDMNEDEKDRPKNSHRRGSDRKKSRRHGSDPESESEDRYKRHKREHRNGSHRNGDHEELEDGEFGDGERWQ